MKQYSNFDSKMGYHFKNETRRKIQTNNENFLRKICFAFLTVSIVFLNGCDNYSNTEFVKNAILHDVDYSISITRNFFRSMLYWLLLFGFMSYSSFYEKILILEIK